MVQESTVRMTTNYKKLRKKNKRSKKWMNTKMLKNGDGYKKVYTTNVRCQIGKDNTDVNLQNHEAYLRSHDTILLADSDVGL